MLSHYCWSRSLGTTPDPDPGTAEKSEDVNNISARRYVAKTFGEKIHFFNYITKPAVRKLIASHFNIHASTCTPLSLSLSCVYSCVCVFICTSVPTQSFQTLCVYACNSMYVHLDGFSKRCLLKLDKKGLILNRRNFGFSAPKLMRFSLKDGQLEDLSF